MRYDFDQVIDRRNTNCEKWDGNLELFGTEDVLPMWVADMDLPCPQPVVDAIRRRLDHPVFGYGFAPQSLYQAIMDRMARRYGWAVEKDWISFTPGVVTGVYAAVRALTVPGDEILVQPPVYFPFFNAVTNSGCQLVHSELRLVGNGHEPGSAGEGTGDRYEMDYEDLARRFEGRGGLAPMARRIKGMILCSPHNPGGRVWTEDELRRLGDICLANGCVIISDEIHCDLLIGEARHTPIATLSKELAENTITMMAPSKTFNLAGLEASFAIIPNPRLRRDFERARLGQGGVNVLGLAAMEAALRDGDDYLAQLNDYLTGNVRYFTEAIARIPGFRPMRPEGTYLVWVDLRELAGRLGLRRDGGHVDDDGLTDFVIRKARIATVPGHVFGPGGSGFHRFNLACPRSVVEEAVSRLEGAVRELGD